MNAGEHIANLFPAAKWTGGSAIHRSRALFKHFEGHQPPAKTMKRMMKEHTANQLWAFLHHTFPNGDWMLCEDEFVALFTQDVWGWLTGHGSTASQKMLKNPNTGNVFHRLVLYPGNIVGGMRFWTEKAGNHLQFGCRFRLETMQEAETKTRQTIRESVEKAVKVSAQIHEMLEVSAPYEEETVKIRVKEEEE